MYEFIPVAAGIVLALAIRGIDSARLRTAIVGVLSILIGVGVASLLGELTASPLFAAFDIAQVLGASYVATLVLRRYATRTSEVGNK